VTIADHPEQAQYEARLDGTVVAVAAYRLGEDLISFTHTEVDPEHRNRGIGESLARFALDDARQRGLLVRPRCSFIRAFIEQHRDYADLVAGPRP
jgi:predicted GNAT family acetyltransferase